MCRLTFLRYLSIQVLAYVIDMGVFLLLVQLNSVEPVIGNIFSKLIAGCFAFLAHRLYTFNVASLGFVRKQAVRYFFVLALNVPVASALFVLIHMWVTLPVMAKFLSDVLMVVLSYVLSKRFIFNSQMTPSDTSESGSKV